MRIVIITGVSRGLGQALSRAMAREDTRLLGFGRSRGDFGGEFHSCDFGNPQLASSIFRSALAEAPLEHADSILFIANAGRLGLLARAENLDAFEIESALAANLAGTAVAAQAFLERVADLPAAKTFAQISSGAAKPERAKASWSLYCASKAGQEQFIRAVAKEQDSAKHPCCFININPGVVETAMQVAIRATPPEVFPEVERFRRLSKEGRIPSPETVAGKIAQLLENPQSLENARTYDLSVK